MSDQASQRTEVDGPSRLFEDELLDRLVGNWKVSGKMGKTPIDHVCGVRWVLNHQFLQVHYLDVSQDGPQDRHSKYDAMVFIGHDNMSERYVAHWLDIFGGRFSETLGYGTRQGENAIMFLFEYPDGPLQNTFTWNKNDGTWSSRIVQKNARGEWTEFLTETMRKLA